MRKFRGKQGGMSQHSCKQLQIWHKICTVADTMSEHSAPVQRSPSPLARIRSASALASGCEVIDKLSSLDWVQAVYDQPGTALVATGGAMSADPSSSDRSGLDPDHLFLSMLRQSLIQDILFLWNSRQQLFHTIVAL
jgi:hypothetical protein